ncbi:MAG: hypothetical protein ACRC2M_19070 [Planktothrix sp.]
MCKPKSIQIPKKFVVDINKLNPQQQQQYLMIRSWSKGRANRYAYFVTHPDYLLHSQIGKFEQASNHYRSMILAIAY